MQSACTVEAARIELAPNGILRVALNHANFLLVTAPAPDAAGVAADLGRALAQSLNAEPRFVGFENAGLAADAAAHDAWDVAFIGADPARASEIVSSDPYVEIEATYLVPPGSRLRTIADVDAPGIRIASARRSAYDLHLERGLRAAQLVRADSIPASFDLFRREGLDALAGLRAGLLQDQERLPGSTVLDGQFMRVRQAIGTRRSCPAGAQHVASFVRSAIGAGMVGRLIADHGIRGVMVAAERSLP
ncbi:MAG: transporter substrate-binding domain-containing protein [Gemmatimonadaceae bacterium]|nr:transporter substrate-binding domain-containing protein [Gemmatimonadaceae bacterium]